MNKETHIQTFSIVAGSEACNARCPFCVSKMTPENGMRLKPIAVNWPRFQRALEYAKEGNTETAMITSKGEPTLFPDQITEYLSAIRSFELNNNFSFKTKELQSNGIAIFQKPEKFNPLLNQWRLMGLDTIAISIVSEDPEKNKDIYMPYAKSYIDLSALIAQIHTAGIAVRLSTVMLDGFIDSDKAVKKIMHFSKENSVEQLTIRPVNKPEESRDLETFEWTKKHHIKPNQLEEVMTYLNRAGRVVRRLPFGATIYDLEGQNVCLTNCLTTDEDDDYLRQLIFYPNGIISQSWTEEGENLP